VTAEVIEAVEVGGSAIKLVKLCMNFFTRDVSTYNRAALNKCSRSQLQPMAEQPGFRLELHLSNQVIWLARHYQRKQAEEAHSAVKFRNIRKLTGRHLPNAPF